MYTKNGMLSRASHTVDDNPHSSQVCKCLCIFHNQVGPQYEWDVGRQDGIHRVLPSTPTSWDRQACCRDIQSGEIAPRLLYPLGIRSPSIPTYFL